MKKFKVTTAKMHIDVRGEAVPMMDTSVIVEADYFRVQEGGVLTFRTEKRGNEQYNPAVRVFAPGFWLEVAVETGSSERSEPVRPSSPYGRDLDLTYDVRRFG